MDENTDKTQVEISEKLLLVSGNIYFDELSRKIHLGSTQSDFINLFSTHRLFKNMEDQTIIWKLDQK